MSVPPPTITVWYDPATSVDITGYGCDIQITRGRSSPFDDIQAGTCSIRAYNRNRALDVFSAASPFFGANTTPMGRIAVEVLDVSIFDGDIEDYSHSYGVGQTPMTSIAAADLLSKLARTSMLEEFTATAGQLPGARISNVLSRAHQNLYDQQNFVTWDAGFSTLQADFVPVSTNALAYINLVARTDLGRFFAERSRLFTYKDRDYTAETAAVTLADTGAGGTIRFVEVDTITGRDAVYTQTIVSRVGGSTETFTDDDAVDVYGVISTGSTFTGLLFEIDSQSYDLGLFLIDILANPGQQFSRFVVNLGRLTDAEREDVLGLDLGMLVRGIYTPKGAGGAAIDQTCIIEGIRHTLTPGSHSVELLVSVGFA